jgi:hypothetical protein
MNGSWTVSKQLLKGKGGGRFQVFKTSPVRFPIIMPGLIEIGEMVWKCIKKKQAHTFLYRYKLFSDTVPTEGVWEQGAEEDIWTEERWSDGRLEETA